MLPGPHIQLPSRCLQCTNDMPHNTVNTMSSILNFPSELLPLLDPSTTQKPVSPSSCSLSHSLDIQTIPKTSQLSILLNIFLNSLTSEHHHDFCLCLCSELHIIHTNHTVRSGPQSHHIPITQHPKLPSTLRSWWSSTQSSSELITRHGIANAPRVSIPLASPFTPDFAFHTLIEWPTYSSRTHNALIIHMTIHAISSTWKCSELLVTLPNSAQISRPSSNTTTARALLWHCHQTASTSVGMLCMCTYLH